MKFNYVNRNISNLLNVIVNVIRKCNRLTITTFQNVCPVFKYLNYYCKYL